MFKNCSGSSKALLVLMAIAISLTGGLDSLRAEQPEVVELTLMIRTHPLAADVIPSPSGENAIGFVLDGNRNPPGDDGVGVQGFGDFDGGYNPTDASYLTKGGTFPAGVYVRGAVLPAHGFINLQRSLILDSATGFATQSGTTFEPDNSENATDYLIFVYGWFEVHSR